MRRKVFATAVVLVTTATPLFAGQDPAAKQPAASSAKQVPASQSAKQQPAPGGAKPQAPSASPAKPQPAPVTAKQAPAPAPAPAGAKQQQPPADSKQQPAVAAVKNAAEPAKQPAAAAGKNAAEPAKQPAAAASAVPASTKSTGKPPAPPKTPTVKLNPVVAAAPKPAPGKAVTASAANAVPTAAAKASVTSLSPLQLKVQSSKTLVSALQPKLAGFDVVNAAEGFKNLQEFVSAVHASHNLGLKFDTLKTKLLAGKRASLRQAIQELRPSASAAIESQRAQYDANGTIRTAEQAEAEAAAAAQAKLKPAAPVAPKPPQQQQ